MGFTVALDALGMEYLGGQVVMVFGKKLSKSLTPVEEESLALLIGADLLTGKCRKPQSHRISPPLFKLFLHPQGPCPLS